MELLLRAAEGLLAPIGYPADRLQSWQTNCQVPEPFPISIAVRI